MEQLVKIIQTNSDGTAQAFHVRESACSGDCHKCSGCGAQRQTMLFDAVNPIGAKMGELVIIQSESAPVLAAAAVLYLMPIALFFLGYLAGEWLLRQGALWGCLAFLLGIAIAALYDRKVVRKQRIVYTITGYPLGSYTKGDNDLD